MQMSLRIAACLRGGLMLVRLAIAADDAGCCCYMSVSLRTESLKNRKEVRF
jgi:hypothetical protein